MSLHRAAPPNFGIICSVVLAGALAASGPTQAQSAMAAAKNADALSFHGITLYGVIDIGFQYDTHAAPVSDYFVFGTESIVQKKSQRPIFALVPNNMAISRIGLRGKEPLFGDWSAIFDLETGFNPQSGELVDCLKSLTINNGKPLTAQTTGVDCSVAGQVFQRGSYVGMSSASIGTLTFGRQRSVLGDGASKYDPQGNASAYSLLGFSGTTGGGGTGEDLFLDSSLKYTAKYGPIRVGGLYQFGEANTSANTAVQFGLGADFSGASIDALYSRKKDAVAAASLSAVQVSALHAMGYSVNNSLAATISDNTAYALEAAYSAQPFKVYAAYEHIEFANPSSAIEPGYSDMGGYTLAFVNNAAYGHHRILQVIWFGVKYAVSPTIDLAAAAYGYRQNSYATGANSGCTTIILASCSGSLNVLSASADWRLSMRFDVYAGTMWSAVANGLASGYLNKSNVATTAGLRFSF